MFTRAQKGLQTASGTPIMLGPLVGAGGEGKVYAHATDPQLVVKIYLNAMDVERQNKLRDMSSMAPHLSDELKGITAWPLDIVAEGKSVVGFTMPKVDAAEEIHVLYGPKSRKQKFPQASFKFLVHVAMNIARAFHVIHEQGFVIGDVNERLVLVSRTGIARVIDCDSFQLRTPKGQQYFCDVGMPGYTPPELQEKSLRGVFRTKDHDTFGLAVMLFHVLFLGRHPYAGRYHRSDEMPMERAIKECRFAYSSDTSRTQMSAPPNTPALTMPGTRIASYFERAFSPEAARGNPRPSAQEWADALRELRDSLKNCSNNAAHSYIPSLSVCPFCQVEASTRFELFHYEEPSGTTYVPIDVDAIWAAIGAITWPTPVAAFDVSTVKRNAKLSAEAEFILRARSEQATLAAAQETLSRAEASEANVNKAIEEEEQDLLAAIDAVASFDADERRNSELGQTLRAMNKKRSYYVYGTIASLLVCALTPGLYTTHQLAGLICGLAIAILTVTFGSTALFLTIKGNRLQREKKALYASLMGGLQARIERRKTAELALESRRARLLKVKDDVRAAAETIRTLEQKVQGEEQAIEQALTVMRARHEDAKDRFDAWQQSRTLLIQELNQSERRFTALRNDAQQFVAEIRKIDQKRKSERDQVSKHERENQLSAYLDTFFITKEDWGKKIPKSLLPALSSYGIETADDITQEAVLAVPGFGKTRTQHLIDWRNRKRAGFRFNPTTVSTSQLAAIDRKYHTIRRDGERKVSKARDQIMLLVSSLKSRAEALNNELAALAPHYGQMLIEVDQVMSVRRGKGTGTAPPMTKAGKGKRP